MQTNRKEQTMLIVNRNNLYEDQKFVVIMVPVIISKP